MTDAPHFDRHMLEALVCPVTHTTLSYDAQAQELVQTVAVFGSGDAVGARHASRLRLA